MSKAIWSLGLLLVSASPAEAYEDTTAASEVGPVFKNGELEGCKVVFNVVHADQEYQKGQLVQLSGSLNYSTLESRVPFFSVKLGVRALDGKSDFVAPAEVYLIEGNRTNKPELITFIKGELPGYRLAAFKAQGITLDTMMKIAKDGRATFGYAMQAGGMLSVAEIDGTIKTLNVDAPAKSELDPNAPRRWAKCVSDVTELGIKKLKGR